MRINIKKIIIHGCDARGDGLDPYLTRWIIVKLRWLGIYFHKFHRSDAEDLHNHPWSFISIILWRGYNEQTFTDNGGLKVERIKPGRIIYRNAAHAHRVMLINDKPACTLVIRFRDTFNWGFFQKGKYIHFLNYFKKMGC